MNTICDQLKVLASTNRPLEEVAAQHLREGVLRRVSRSKYVDGWVLRGGMLTQIWVAPGMRVAQDVDFLGLYPFDVDVTAERLYSALSDTAVEDGVTFNLDSFRSQVIWAETEFPGARVNIDASVGEYSNDIQIDVGFGDPLIQPVQWLEYPTLISSVPVHLQACQPETLVGWKLHGLVEFGRKRWRAKDLYDLMLLTTYVKLDDAALLNTIRIAFSSRSTSLQKAQEMICSPAWWNPLRNHNRWARFRNSCPTQPIPEDLAPCVAVVSERLKGVVEQLAREEQLIPGGLI